MAMGGQPERGSVSAAAAGLRAVPRPPHVPFPETLPSRTPLVGRDADVERALAAIGDESSLITAVGPGGVGKTRLAIEVGHRVWAEAPGSVLFVPLTFVTEAGRVPDAVTAAAGWDLTDGASAIGQIADRLRGWATLLVLDNCEQIEAFDELAAELAAAWPTTTMLVTSRRPLNLTVERVVAVEPLALPRPDASWREIATSPAVVAIVNTVARRVPGYAVTRDNAHALGELCARLDGLPLALELAAARLHHITPAELLELLDQRFDVLHDGASDRTPHHRRLWAAIDWSYQLLPPDAQRQFRHLATFADGFTLDAASQVLAIDRVAALDGIGVLTGHHLVRPVGERAGASRFEMLESIREFARAELDTNGELDSVHAAHAAWATETAQQLHRRINTSDLDQVLAAFDAERENFRSALRWQLDHGDRGALRLAHGHWVYWHIRGAAREGLSWVHAALDAAEPATDQAAANALLAAGNLHDSLGEMRSARDLLERAAMAFERLGDHPRVAAAWHTLAAVARESGDLDRAAQLQRDALAIYLDTDAVRDQAIALNGLGVISYRRGDADESRAHFLRAAELFESCGDQIGLAHALDRVGLTHQRTDDPAAALNWHHRAQAIAERAGDAPTAANAMVNAGEALVAAGDVDAAAATLAQVAHLAAEIGDARIAAHVKQLAGGVADRRGEIGAAIGEHLAAFSGFARAGYTLEAVEAAERLALLVDELVGGELVTECLAVAATGRAATRTTWSGEVAALADSIDSAALRVPEPDFEQQLVRMTAAAPVLTSKLRAVALEHGAARRTSAPSADPLLALGLTRREAEVARLVTDRRTDQEIADELFVAARTASTHVSAVLRKLGVTSRRQVATRLAELGIQT